MSTYIIAEIGINHNGSLETAKKLIDIAAVSGCDAVKFQKRNPDVCVPEHQKGVLRETPWGTMTYLDYKYRVEFGKEEYDEIDETYEKPIVSQKLKSNNCNCDICMKMRVDLINYHSFEPNDQLSQMFKGSIDITCDKYNIYI